MQAEYIPLPFVDRNYSAQRHFLKVLEEYIQSGLHLTHEIRHCFIYININSWDTDVRGDRTGLTARRTGKIPSRR